jgi:flavorubredoxin
MGAAGWAVSIIAPSHGVIWRGELVARAQEAYARWNAATLRDKVIVAYSTMWGSTDELAKTIADAVVGQGVDVEVFDLAATPFATITHALLDARGLLIGTPTLHRGMLFRVAAYLHYLGALKPTGRIGAAFGSYGWSSGATAQVVARFGEIGIDVVQDPYTQKFRPTVEELAAARAWGAAFGLAVKGAGHTGS